MLTDEQRRVLQPFVTSLDDPVYALLNLPPQVAGAVLSRFSRSDKGARELLATEFINDLPKNDPECEAVTTRADDFYDRVLTAYGDESIAELGGIHIVTERVSLLAAKEMEDRRFLSPLEQSTRYVKMERREDGTYPYITPVEVWDHSPELKIMYQAALDRLFDRYHEALGFVAAFLFDNLIKPTATSEAAWQRSIHAKTLDICRGLLPFATHTNVGMFASARTIEYLINCAMSSPVNEVSTLGHKIYGVCHTVMPALVRRVMTDKGLWLRQRLRLLNQRSRRFIPVSIAEHLEHKGAWHKDQSDRTVTMIDWQTQEDAIRTVIETLFFEESNATMQSVRTFMHSHEYHAESILDSYVGERRSRFDRPGRAFEKVRYKFEIESSIAAWRDLQRHRLTTQHKQRFGTSLGYVIPDVIRAMDKEDWWCDTVGNAGVTADFVRLKTNEHIGAYALPLCYRMRWTLEANLRELFHLIELRSGIQGHEEYRHIVWDMADLMQSIHPRLMKYMNHINREAIDLPRLKSEERQEERIENRTRLH